MTTHVQINHAPWLAGYSVDEYELIEETPEFLMLRYLRAPHASRPGGNIQWLSKKRAAKLEQKGELRFLEQ